MILDEKAKKDYASECFDFITPKKQTIVDQGLIFTSSLKNIVAR